MKRRGQGGGAGNPFAPPAPGDATAAKGGTGRRSRTLDVPGDFRKVASTPIHERGDVPRVLAAPLLALRAKAGAARGAGAAAETVGGGHPSGRASGGGSGGRGAFGRTTSDPSTPADTPHLHSSRYATARFPPQLSVAATAAVAGATPAIGGGGSPQSRGVVVRGNLRRLTSGLGRSFRKIQGRPKFRPAAPPARGGGSGWGRKANGAAAGGGAHGSASGTTADAFAPVLAAVRKGEAPLEALLDAMATLSERLADGDAEALFKHLATPAVLDALLRVVLGRRDGPRTAVVMNVLVRGPPRLRKGILQSGALREPLFRFLEHPAAADQAEAARERQAAASAVAAAAAAAAGGWPGGGGGLSPLGGRLAGAWSAARSPRAQSAGASAASLILSGARSQPASAPMLAATSDSCIIVEPQSPVSRHGVRSVWAAGAAQLLGGGVPAPAPGPAPIPSLEEPDAPVDLSVVAGRVARLLAALLNDAPEEFAKVAAKRRSFVADLLKVCASTGCVVDVLPPLLSANSYYALSPPEDLRYGATNAVGVVLLADANVLTLLVHRFTAAVDVVPATAGSLAAVENCLAMAVALSLRCIPPLRWEPSKRPDQATVARLTTLADRLSIISRPAHVGALLDAAFGVASRDGGLALRRTLAALTDMMRTIRLGTVSAQPATRAIMAALDMGPMERELAMRIPALASVLRAESGPGGAGQRGGPLSTLAAPVSSGGATAADAVAMGCPLPCFPQREAPPTQGSVASPPRERGCGSGGGVGSGGELPSSWSQRAGGGGATIPSGAATSSAQSSPLSSTSPSWTTASCPPSPGTGTSCGGDGSGAGRVGGMEERGFAAPSTSSAMSLVVSTPPSPNAACPSSPTSPATLPAVPLVAAAGGATAGTPLADATPAGVVRATPLPVPLTPASSTAPHRPSTPASIGTAYERVRSPLGSIRVAVLDLLALVFSSNCPEAHAALAAASVPSTLMELFCALRWNSILHRSVADCVAVSLACPSTALHRAWLTEAELPARTLELYARAFDVSTRRLRRPRTQPAAYVGDVMRMADAMRQFVARHRGQLERGCMAEPGGVGGGDAAAAAVATAVTPATPSAGRGSGGSGSAPTSDGGPLVRGVGGAGAAALGPTFGAPPARGDAVALPTACREAPAAVGGLAAPAYTHEALLGLFGGTPAAGAAALKALDAFTEGTLQAYKANAVKPLGGARPTVYSGSTFAPLRTNSSLNVD